MDKSKWPPIIQNGRQKNANHIFSLDYHIVFLKNIILKNVPKNSTKPHKGIYYYGDLKIFIYVRENYYVRISHKLLVHDLIC